MLYLYRKGNYRNVINMDNPVQETPSRPARLLNEIESKEILKRVGLTVTEPVPAGSAAEAAALAEKTGFPVVLKIVSDAITHKSDAGGVITGLSDAASVEQAYRDIIAAVSNNCPDVPIDGISVQPQAPAGSEVIIGMTRDAQFGPAIMFGLGGVLVEIFNDVSFRIAPITRQDAVEMIGELKGAKLLRGYRGQPAADTDILVNWLLKVSELVTQNLRIKELDINPIFVYEKGAVAVDARIVVED
jgi:acyl-CoA synthetase (NDP forming)